MSSSRSVPAVRRRLPACCALALLALAACGKQGDPLPPLRTVPLTTSDLAVRQQGGVLLLEMGYPAVTTGGVALGGIDAIEVRQLATLAPEGEAPPIDAQAFEAGAKPLLTLRGADLGATVTGDRIQIQLPLEQPLPETPQALTFAVKTVKAREFSATSNRATIVPQAPPPAPRDLEVEPGPGGIALSWQLDGEDPEGFDIYRRRAIERGYGQALARVGGEARSFVDRDARFGQRYIYTVRTVVSSEPPIASAEAGEREIDYRDRFAPPLPANFVALGEKNSVRLRWDPSPAPDVAGYVLYRREPGREFHRLLDDPVVGVEHIDRGLAAGLSYDYRIQVVDRLGNESELSAPVSATVR